MEGKTKITLQIGDSTVTWENNYTDNTLEDLYNAFEGLLVTHTYSQDSIRRFLIEKSEELNEIFYKDETED
jgi:hypothetical protein